MLKKIIYIVGGAILAIPILFMVLTFALRDFFHNERGSMLIRVAYCQFFGVQGELMKNPKFWNDAYDTENWHSLIDLEEAACNSELLLTDSKIFDATGAEIRLSVSPDGVKYLSRVKGPNKEFISVSSEVDKYEFPVPTAADKRILTSDKSKIDNEIDKQK